MQPNLPAEESWEEYRARELAAVEPLLAELGFELEELQPHIAGERSVMQAVTTATGRKLVLLGRRKAGDTRVVIKATSDPAGIEALAAEQRASARLRNISFAYRAFLTPTEMLTTRRADYALSIHEFIEQEQSFLERPLEEQFELALKAFKAQEGAHATTYGHERLIRSAFESAGAAEYLALFRGFEEKILAREYEDRLPALLARAKSLLAQHQETIEQYCGFLTHTDFVPHNFRVVAGEIYLLDNSSLRFGNKYEGWARFINFMALYNPELEAALVEYVRANRTPEESLALTLMRMYRLGEIIWYYTKTLERSEGDLRELNQERVRFWSDVLAAVLADSTVPLARLEHYRAKRDRLRSPEEKLRQKGLY